MRKVYETSRKAACSPASCAIGRGSRRQERNNAKKLGETSSNLRRTLRKKLPGTVVSFSRLNIIVELRSGFLVLKRVLNSFSNDRHTVRTQSAKERTLNKLYSRGRFISRLISRGDVQIFRAFADVGREKFSSVSYPWPFAAVELINTSKSSPTVSWRLHWQKKSHPTAVEAVGGEKEQKGAGCRWRRGKQAWNGKKMNYATNRKCWSRWNSRVLSHLVSCSRSFLLFPFFTLFRVLRTLVPFPSTESAREKTENANDEK